MKCDLSIFQETGPLVEVCAVIGILDRSFQVLLLTSGITRRIYLEVSTHAQETLTTHVHNTRAWRLGRKRFIFTVFDISKW